MPDAPVTSVDGRKFDDAEGPKKRSKGPKLADVLANQAWQLTAKGSHKLRCLVFCNAREDATAVADALRDLAKSAGANEPPIELFVGARRVKERRQAYDDLARHGFLAGTAANLERPAFLIATSAGEVGVDLDADHMVCDLVAWERMVQRLGRVNRRGDGDAQVVVVVDREPVPSDGTTKAIEKKEAANAAKKRLDELTHRLNELQGERAAVSKGRKKSAHDQAAEKKRDQAAKELKKSISACQDGIKAFKDADAKVVARYEGAVKQHRALRKLLAAV